MKIADLRQLEETRLAQQPVVRAVLLPSAEGTGGGEVHILSPETEGPLQVAAQTVLRSDRAEVVEQGEQRWFLQPFNPPLRMVLVGAVHIAQPLGQMAALAGYHVHLVDPREAFAHAARFPGMEMSTDWPDEALEALEPNARTAVVTLTHDPKLDDPALEVALRSPAFYIGCLGSKKTHAARLGRLERKGFDEEARARLRGPVGLAIGARSPAEIAVSILAQVTETLRKEA